MPRFFLEPSALQGGFVTLTGELAAHAKVLRLRRGDEVMVCDGLGTDYRCTVSDMSSQQISLVIHSQSPSDAEPEVPCSVYAAFPKADKLEQIIQKATELGAFELVVFPAARCISLPDDKSRNRKLERWKKIAVSAAEQSGRGRIPDVLMMSSFRAAVERAAAADLSLLLYENENHLSMRQAVEAASYRSAAVMTGPEGGLTPEEVSVAREAGMKICSLGPRILRCETAPLCALTIVMYETDAFCPRRPEEKDDITNAESQS